MSFTYNPTENAYYNGRRHDFSSYWFPAFDNVLEAQAFLRGYFEVHGSMNRRNLLNSHDTLVVSLKKNVNVVIHEYLDEFKFCQPDELKPTEIIYYNVNAIEFLNQLYCNSTPNERLETHYLIYMEWINQTYQTTPSCIFAICSSDKESVVIPTKNRISDVGYDLTIIKPVKKYGSRTTMFDTGIYIRPPIGYYTKIVPRSSLIKSGYILTNSVGIIDTGFSDTLKICLTKIDDSLPDLTLPFKCCQLILEKLNHYDLVEQEESEFNSKVTTRGKGGFGSTDMIKKD